MQESIPVWLPMAVFPFAFLALWATVLLLLSLTAGWPGLAKAYPAFGTADGPLIRCRRARIGLTSYSGCLNLNAGSTHLHMVPMLIFRIWHPRVSVPWHEVSATTRKGWFSEVVELHFEKVPRRRIQLDGRSGKALADASMGQLELPPIEG